MTKKIQTKNQTKIFRVQAIYAHVGPFGRNCLVLILFVFSDNLVVHFSFHSSSSTITTASPPSAAAAATAAATSDATDATAAATFSRADEDQVGMTH